MSVLSFPAPSVSDPAFADASQFEEDGKMDSAEKAYFEILRTSGDARAAINLGTIAYHRRHYATAEEFYRLAVRTEPQNVLAWFNLGNALDELVRREEAIAAFETALRLDPAYADAHFNLALTLERVGRRSQALRHWQTYVKLDRTGSCALWANRRIRALTEESGLRCVTHLEKRQGVFIVQGPSAG